MTDKKPVICPHCGHEMYLAARCDSYYAPYYYCCPYCMSRSPRRITADKAYASAMQRYEPPIKPPHRLTPAEMERRTDPVWVELGDDAPWQKEHGYYCLCNRGHITPPSRDAFWAKDRDWLYLDRRPTDEERAAAPWEEETNADT